jgi:hypothetical protein
MHSYGQERPVYPAAEAGEQPQILRIQDFEGLNRRSVIETPQYDTNMRGGVKEEREWVEIRTTYDTAPEWIDNLTFQYYAMSRTEVEGRPAYSLFTETVTYADIQKDDDHFSTAYLRPAAVLRYGELVAIAVEIRFEGDLIAYVSDKEDNNLPADWWKNKQVLNSDILTERAGYLLDRKSSPFAYINIEDYEFIQE